LAIYLTMKFLKDIISDDSKLSVNVRSYTNSTGICISKKREQMFIYKRFVNYNAAPANQLDIYPHIYYCIQRGIKNGDVCHATRV
jgi:hypothetical protein